MDSGVGSMLALLVVLVGLSAFFSSAESALLSANKVRLMNMQDEGNKRAGRVLALLEQQSKVISTILVGNNVVNIGASSLATKVALDIWGDVGLGLATGIMTLVILVFGEVVPKNIGSSKANTWAMTVSGPLSILMLLLTPVVWILSEISRLVGKLAKTDEDDPFITEDELKILVNAGQEEGILDENETEMINSIFEFDETTVKEIMVPRIDMLAIDGEDTIKEVLADIIAAGHSRIPVYEESIDNIVGILYVKDLLKNLDRDFSVCKVKELLRQVYFIPENKNVSDLLAEMRQKRVHMAVILDEYGGTAGLITIEDLIEEIVGDIQDEYDSEEELIKPLPDANAVMADARALVYDVAQALNVEFSEETESETIGGLVFNNIGGIPSVGDEATYERLHMKVAEVKGHRVSKVEVEALPEEEDEEKSDWLSRRISHKEDDRND